MIFLYGSISSCKYVHMQPMCLFINDMHAIQIKGGFI